MVAAFERSEKVGVRVEAAGQRVGEAERQSAHLFGKCLKRGYGELSNRDQMVTGDLHPLGRGNPRLIKGSLKFS